METLKERLISKYEHPIFYFCVSFEGDTLYEWKPKNFFGNFLLELQLIQKETTTYDGYFYHILRGKYRISYIKNADFKFIISSDKEIPLQLSEAIIEQLEKKFKEMYDISIILSYSDINPNIFKEFDEIITEFTQNIDAFDLIREVLVECKVCGEQFKLIIKRGLIDSAVFFPIPVVCNHHGHAIICYIDAHGNCRGSNFVNFAG